MNRDQVKEIAREYAIEAALAAIEYGDIDKLSDEYAQFLSESLSYCHEVAHTAASLAVISAAWTEIDIDMADYQYENRFDQVVARLAFDVLYRLACCVISPDELADLRELAYDVAESAADYLLEEYEQEPAPSTIKAAILKKIKGAR